MAFLNSDRFNGQEFLPLDPTEFHQMTGRAGRRGMDRIGFALVVPGKFMNVRLVAKLVNAPPSDVLSQIRINFSMALNLLLSHRPEEVDSLLDRSFATYLIGRREQQKKATAGEDQRKLLGRDFHRHLDFLKAKEFVDPRGTLTEDGQWASQLRVDQPLVIAEGIRRALSPKTTRPVWRGSSPHSSTKGNTRPMPKASSASCPATCWRTSSGWARELRRFLEDLRAGGFDVRRLYFRPAATVWAWARGHSWEDVCRLGETEEGDLAMLILRTADNLRHIRSLDAYFPAVARTAGEAVDLILRTPVTAEMVLQSGSDQS